MAFADGTRVSVRGSTARGAGVQEASLLGARLGLGLDACALVLPLRERVPARSRVERLQCGDLRSNDSELLAGVVKHAKVDDAARIRALVGDELLLEERVPNGIAERQHNLVASFLFGVESRDRFGRPFRGLRFEGNGVGRLLRGERRVIAREPHRSLPDLDGSALPRVERASRWPRHAAKEFDLLAHLPPHLHAFVVIRGAKAKRRAAVGGSRVGFVGMSDGRGEKKGGESKGAAHRPHAAKNFGDAQHPAGDVRGPS